MTTKILSQSSKMSELLKEKIVIIEDLNKKRRPMPKFDAIYFITPTRISLNLVVEDFVEKNHYKSKHVFV
jgi:syntaxin-binding protein 1